MYDEGEECSVKAKMGNAKEKKCKVRKDTCRVGKVWEKGVHETHGRKV
jgi:hypothetical protein